MRSFVLIIATVILLAGLAVGPSGTAAAQPPPPTLSVTIHGNSTEDGHFVYENNTILVPQVPIVLIVTFRNVDTTIHSFTINDENGTRTVDTTILDPGEEATVTFTVLSMSRVSYNGTDFTPERQRGGILFYCIPHRGGGIFGAPTDMVGLILLATLQAGEAPERGILIRAYWIGLIGIGAMLVWIGISYFVIKSSSRRFTDHREHIRKGLP